MKKIPLIAKQFGKYSLHVVLPKACNFQKGQEIWVDCDEVKITTESLKLDRDAIKFQLRKELEDFTREFKQNFSKEEILKLIDGALSDFLLSQEFKDQVELILSRFQG